MSNDLLNHAAPEVLAHFPELTPHGPPQAVTGSAGFSGALIWRVATPHDGFVCLRAWPAATEPRQVALAHQLMAHARCLGLEFVPQLFVASAARTVLEHAGRLWEVQQWMPGQADFHQHPSRERLQMACTALARLHTAWSRPDWAREGPCPAVLRRMAVIEKWRQLAAHGWRLLDVVHRDDPLRSIAERACRVLPPLIEHAAANLHAAHGVLDLQPCLRDPWHDHYLFDGNRLTGLIDYGAVQLDHPAVDLARTLGSLVEDGDADWQTGLAAYRNMRALSLTEEALARLLDRTGTILSTAKWLMRLFHERESVPDRVALAARLQRLLARLEKWHSS